MSLRTRTTVAAALIAIALSGARAQAAPMTTPAVMQLAGKPTTIRIMVLAGTTGAQNGFMVEWMTRADFDARDGFPAAGDPALNSGDFFGAPVWIVEGSSGDFTLPPLTWQVIEIGELFDESGVTTQSPGELTASTDYVLRVTARATDAYTASLPTAPLFVRTGVPAANCTFTQGYWKNHAGVWSESSLVLGTVTYSAAQLLAILNTPARGNGLLILAHQLIAAKLSIAGGADPSQVISSISAADGLIGSLVCPPVGSGSLSPSAAGALATTIDAFNNGMLGPGHCGTTPASVSSWGSIKSAYRR